MNKTKKKGISNTKSDNKYLRIILIVILTICVGIIIGVISYTAYNISQLKPPHAGDIIKETKLNASIEVGRRTGMNGDRDGLKFGLNTPGGGGTKFIDINSSERALVTLYLTGNISGYLTAERNNFIVERGEFVHLPISLDLPTNMSFGNYTGVVTVILTRP